MPTPRNKKNKIHFSLYGSVVHTVLGAIHLSIYDVHKKSGF